MSKTKILDLDKFETSEPSRSITIKGITYPVEDMTFDNFVETTNAAQQLDANENATTADHMEASVKMIQRTVPTIPGEVLRAMTLSKLSVIIRFLNGDMDEEMEKTATEAAEAGGAEAKK